MARQRDDQGFDDDDYLPPQQSSVSSGRSRPTWVFLVLCGIGLAIGSLVVLFFMRSQRAVHQARAALDEQETQRAVAAQIQLPATKGRLANIHTRAAATSPRGKPRANWEMVIGTWRRGPYSRMDELPVEIIFRPDFTAQVTRVRPTQNLIDEALVEVKEDAGDRLSLSLHTEKGESVYSFRMNPDGTMVYDDGGPGLTLSKMK